MVQSAPAAAEQHIVQQATTKLYTRTYDVRPRVIIQNKSELNVASGLKTLKKY